MGKTAEEHVKKAKKALKTHLFKWNKDYVSAAIHFDEAAKKFKAEKKYERAIWVYEQLIKV